MRFGVLGPLRVWTAEGEDVAIGEAKVRVLLADLLAHAGHPVPVHRLVRDLWGEELPANPSAALHTKVSRLRGSLGAAGLAGPVVKQPGGYQLRAEAEAVDAGRFEALAGRARRSEDPSVRARLFGEALALWRGPAFDGFAEEPFARSAAARLEEERLLVLEERALARLALGEHAEVAAELAGLVTRHPLRERLHGVRMRALYAAGRQSEALAGYQELRDRLVAELGVDPSPELSELYAAILRQDRGLTPTARRDNLPAQVTDLIGRDDDVKDVRSSVAGRRLVTLTGPGGVGKTRLAVEATTGMVGDFADGVRLVELASLDPRGGTAVLAAQVMRVLDIRDDAPGPLTHAEPLDPPDRLAAALAAKRLLLVLDNCEHLIADVAELAAHLLRSAPGLSLLTTSRERLGLPGEVVLPVAPLALPSAVRLFVTRAAAATPGFVPAPEDEAVVTEICRRLDGLPLALELAATRVGVLGLRELAARLDDRFRLLGNGQRGVPSRQRTLRAVIDWSWELLEEQERVVLRRLAVHAGGCTLQAAEEICGGDGIDVLDALGRLVDRSLVTVTDGPRYRLLESVAEYSRERLREAGEEDLVRDRHVRHFGRLADRAELRGHDQCDWLSRLDAEAGNLHRAVRHAPRSRALSLVNALTWYWVLRGRLDEARSALEAVCGRVDAPWPPPADEPEEVRGPLAEARVWQVGVELLRGHGHDRRTRIERALAAYRDLADPLALARARWFLGYAGYGTADLALGEELLARALDGFRALDDRWGEAAVLCALANTALARGELAFARERAERSAALFTDLGDHWGLSQTSYPLGVLAEIRGDYPEAARLLRAGLRMAEELGLWSEVADRMSALGRIALLVGDFDGGRDLHERAVRLAAEQAFTPGERYAQIGLALGARRQGLLDEAERHLREVLAWFREYDHYGATALLVAELGFVAELRGEAAEARRLHAEGFEEARVFGDPRGLALALEGLAGAEALAGDARKAAVLLGAADRARRSTGAPLPQGERGDVDRIETAARRDLGEEAFTEASAQGARLSPEEAYAFAR
ncbi:BTAD domain-containing putative transcriptional regulator [Nonomuraea sp. NPDC049714]|uniref:BTAD domain-containing putative transcriptional regulator n=1 Tax=Nonomuraea sp. NPDC049714 TaxID=3364357 RepID=UPI0037B26F8F